MRIKVRTESFKLYEFYIGSNTQAEINYNDSFNATILRNKI